MQQLYVPRAEPVLFTGFENSKKVDTEVESGVRQQKEAENFIEDQHEQEIMKNCEKVQLCFTLMRDLAVIGTWRGVYFWESGKIQVITQMRRFMWELLSEFSRFDWLTL